VIPRWQWTAIIILLLAMAGIGIENAPNSYAYLFLSGHCSGANAPAACHPRAGGRGASSRWN
jgi:hypothetical protein